MNGNDNKELTTLEASERLGISKRQVQTLIQQGRLPAHKRGRDWFIYESDVDNLPERKKTGRPSKKAEQASDDAEKQ